MNHLRSILYTPGHRLELIGKAMRAGADAVCLVLEDSVPHDRRVQARTLVRESIAEYGGAGRTVLVKANALGPDGFQSDIAAVVRPGLAGLIVPKVSTVGDVLEADRIVALAEADHGVAPGSVALILMIETPRAVVYAHQLASAAPRVGSVVCAAAMNGDLAGALGMSATEEGLERLYVLSKVLVDARAGGIDAPLDGVWTRIGDLEGLAREARLARSLGYRGKLAIHPEQIDTIHRIFTPTADEVAHSRRVIEVFSAALERGEAAIIVDGVMIDYAMVETARRVLVQAADLRGAPA